MSRWTSWICLTLVFALVRPVSADEFDDAADAVVAAVTAEDQETLTELAERSTPDPWIVADRLYARGAGDAAAAFAAVDSRADVKGIAAFVASRAGKKPNTAAREALAVANAALAAGELAQAVAALKDVDGGDDAIPAIRIAYGRGLALQNLGKFAESAPVLLGAGDLALKLGWYFRAANAFQQAGFSAYRGRDFRTAIAHWKRRIEVEKLRGADGGVAQTSQNIGLMHDKLGEYDAAIEAFTQALKISRALGRRAQESAALAMLGNCYGALGRPADALKQHAASLTINEELANEFGIARDLLNMGNAKKSLGQRTEALECQKRAASIFEKLGQQGAMAVALGNIGNLLDEMGEMDQAVEYQERALAIMDEAGDDLGVSRSLINLSSLYQKLNRGDEAVAAAERALQIAEKLNQPHALAGALNSMGSVLDFARRAREALPYFERACEMLEKMGAIRDVGAVLTNMGRQYERLSEAATAVQYYERALVLLRKAKARQDVANTLANMGICFYVFGSYERAAECHAESRDIYREIGIPTEVAKAIGNLGNIELRRGNFAGAFALHEKCLAMYEEEEHQDGVARALLNIGNAHLRTGNAEKAIAFHTRARDKYVEIGSRKGEAITTGNLGADYKQNGELERARAPMERALAIYREVENRSGEASSLENLALLCADDERFDDALVHAAAALVLREQLGNDAMRSGSLATLSSIHFDKGDYDKSLTYKQSSLELAEKTASVFSQVVVLGGIAEVQLKLGRHAEAVAAARTAAERIPRVVGGLADEQGAGARGQFAEIFEFGLGGALATGDTESACFFLESGRAGTLLESLGGRSRLAEATVPDDLRAAVAAAHELEARAGDEYKRAREARKLRGIRDAKKGLDTAREGVDDAIARVQRQAKAAADVVYPKPRKLADLQAGLQVGETMVLYGRTADRGVALVVDKARARLIGLSAWDAIEEACTAVDAGDPSTPATASLDTIRALVVEPLDLAKSSRHVIVSPYGALSYVPFAALLQDREVSYVPSGTTLGMLAADAPVQGSGVLALGDPDYTGAGGTGGSRGGVRLAPLPATRIEAETVGTVSLLGKAATETELVARLVGSGAPKRWRALHLACHGLIDAERPSRSSLAISADASSDGMLTMIEIVGMRVPADLVVLSACETAKGRIYRAEGVVGLTRAFMLAGSPRVLVSLWKVDDEATKELMVKFYELWTPGAGKKGMPAAAALRSAQAHVRAQKKWEHPAYWAAWQLWGLGR